MIFVIEHKLGHAVVGHKFDGPANVVGHRLPVAVTVVSNCLAISIIFNKRDAPTVSTKTCASLSEDAPRAPPQCFRCLAPHVVVTCVMNLIEAREQMPAGARPSLERRDEIWKLLICDDRATVFL